jgi:hypothetical protein
MDLPETMQPSSDRRLLTWLGTFAALTAGAVWIDRHRRATRHVG